MRAATAMCTVCVLSSICVVVFDRDELTCIKLLRLCRKIFFHVLLVVWVDPNPFPTLPCRSFRTLEEC